VVEPAGAVAHMVTERHQPFAGAYDGLNVLVTGHTGFKGSWLSLWLLRLGASVTGFATEPPTHPSLFDDCKLANDMRSVIGDVTDGRAVADLVTQLRPDVVFHLAAQPIVLASYDDPLVTFATNVMGTANVLDAVRRTASVGATVVVTTDKCYETSLTSPPHPENDRLGGKDPYSASKACAELVTAAFRSSYDLPASGQGVATTRAGNIIGGGDWADARILPDCARALAGGTTLRLRHPTAVRPWQHVLDALAGYLHLGQRLLHHPGAYSEAWNFGPDPTKPFTVADTVDTFVDACARLDAQADRRGIEPLRVEIEGTPKHFEQPSLRLATDKAHTRLGWSPLLDFPSAVEWTAEWYWRHRFGIRFDARDATMQQIRDYESQAAALEAVWAA
jgi:CDP-glucose 4,6-dehydratase